MENNFTDEELEALHLAAMFAMNRLLKPFSISETIYPVRIANDSYAIAEAMIIKARTYNKD